MAICRLRFLSALALTAFTFSAAANAAAPTGRYVVKNDGTGNGTVYDTKTQLTWQQTVASTAYSWANAKTYCASVGASLGGTGWRLPTLKELLTIVDYSQGSPSIDSTVFPSTPSKHLRAQTVPRNTWFPASGRLAGAPEHPRLLPHHSVTPLRGVLSPQITVGSDLEELVL